VNEEQWLLVAWLGVCCCDRVAKKVAIAVDKSWCRACLRVSLSQFRINYGWRW